VEDILGIVKASQDTSLTHDGSLEEGSHPMVSVSKNPHGTDQVITTVHTRGVTDPDIINERVFLRMSVYMIYCDRIFDLLAKQNQKVKLEQYLDQQSQQVVSRFVNM
jgi:hypothetical protein